MITSPYDIQIDENVLEQHSYQSLSDARKPYYFQRHFCSKEECEMMIDMWKEDECFIEKDVDENSPWFKYFRERRSRSHMFLEDKRHSSTHPMNNFLLERLIPTVNQSNIENFFLDISYGLMSSQLMLYEEGDWFELHDDTNHWDNNFYDRKITVIIQLSDEKDYEGGSTILGMPNEIMQPEHQKEQGSLLVFPTFLVHEVKPITKGIRKGFICWFAGPKFR